MSLSPQVVSVLRDLELLHPVARPVFLRLAQLLDADFIAGRTSTLFRPFETYRTPQRQLLLFQANKSKTTNAGPWSSAHQYGLAVDFVAYRDQWSWDASEDWDHLRARATEVGLRNDIAWDRAHVEHPVFDQLRATLRYLKPIPAASA